LGKIVKHSIEIEVFENIGDLSASDKELVNKAVEISDTAYAPYSQFYVGAALKLSSGKIITGSNQENVAYPSGLCAERVAIYYANSMYPDETIETIAVSAKTKAFEMSNPVSPCGSCRQAIAEYEIKQEKPIRLIMAGEKGEIHLATGIRTLLPFMFNETDLKKE
jgi:cytidine deaminase